MSKEIRNVIKPNVFVEVEKMMDSQEIVTPKILDEMQERYYEFLKEKGYNIGRNGVREIIVEVILDNFSTPAFGVEPAAWTAGEITDKTIKKYKKQFN